MPDKAIRAVLQYDVDQAKLQKTVASAVQVAGSVDKINEALARGYAAGKSFDEVMKELGASPGLQGVAADATNAGGNINIATTNTKNLTASLDAAQASASGLTQRLKEAAAARASAGSGDFVDSLRADAFGGGGAGSGPDLGRIGSELRKLPSIQIPGTGVGTDAIANVIRLGGAAQGLGVELGTLVPVAGLAVAAIAGVALAIQHFAGDSKKATEDYLASQPQFVKALTESTRVQVEADLKDAENRKKAAQLTIDLSQSILDNAEAAIKKQAPTSSETVIGVTKLFDFGGINEVQASIDEAKKALGSASLDIDHYNAVLNNNSTAAADAAKNEQDLLDARRAMANTVKQLVIDEGNYATASTSALQSTLARLKLDQQGNSAALSGLAPDDTTRKLYQDAIKEDQKRIEAITQTYLTLSQERDKEIQQMDILTRSSQAYTEFFTKNIADQKKANDDLAKLDLDHADKITQIKQDAADKETQIALDYADKIASIRADEADKEASALSDRNGKLADAQTKASDALVQLSQDNADKRARIERDFASSADTAIANRDAAAFGAAEKKRDNDLKDLNDANARQKATIKRALADQQVTIEKAYQKQLSTVRAAEQKQLDNAYAAEQKSLNAAATAANRQLALENQKYTSEVTLRQRALDIMIAQYQAMIARISGAGNVGANGAPSNVLTGVNYTTDPRGLTPEQYRLWAHFNHIPGYALGGIAQGASWINEKGIESGRDLQTGRMMYFANPTQIYTAQQTAVMGTGNRGNFILNVNGVGRTKGQLMQEIERKVDRFVESF